MARKMGVDPLSTVGGEAGQSDMAQRQLRNLQHAREGGEAKRGDLSKGGQRRKSRSKERPR